MGQVYSAYDPELDRKVAVKLVPLREGSAEAAGEDQSRLMREARAMARLAHPNVVAVFDVGTYGDRIFIAMELVAGKTLNAWLAERRPGWRQVLSVFVEAGRGLAAAHEAGIVHRDFKPTNVLVGNDGRPRVTDFGLARGEGGSGEVMSSGPFAAVPSPATQDRQSALTAVGAVMGTPSFMSPEQMDGHGVDTRSDQFSYCVALYEALYGELPFSGTTLDERAQRISRGEVKPAARGRHVPFRLRAILLRGLSARPEDRFASMDDLLKAVARFLLSRRRRAVAGVVVLIGLVLAGSRMLAARAEGRCVDVAARLTGAWDPRTKAAVRKAFDASGRPYASDAWRGTERILDAWTREWAAQAFTTCDAVRRDPQAKLPMRQQACLDEDLLELKELTELLSAADAKLVRVAVGAASALSPVARCADPTRLPALDDSPDETVRRRLAALRQRLAEATALRDAGQYARGIPICEDLVRAAKAPADDVLLAEATLELGFLQLDAGNTRTAIQALEEADMAGDAAGLDWIRTTAAVNLVYANYLIDDLGGAHAWLDRAQIRLKRLGGDEALQIRLLLNEATVLGEESQFRESIRRYQTVLARAKSFYGVEHPVVAEVAYDLAEELGEAGDWDAARSAAEDALRTHELVFGKDHPDTQIASAMMADTLLGQGDYDRALSLARASLRSEEREYEPDHFRIGEVAHTYGLALLAHGDRETAATELGRARRIFEKTFGEDDWTTAWVITDQGVAARAAGDRTRAAALAREALSILEHEKTRRDLVALPLRLLGDLALDESRHRDALSYFQRALDAELPVFGSTGTDLAPSYTGIGEAALGIGNVTLALSSLERAVSLRQGHELPGEIEGRTQFALARALWAQAVDRPRALALARQAKARFLAGAPRERRTAEVVDRWLGERATAAR